MQPYKVQVPRALFKWHGSWRGLHAQSLQMVAQALAQKALLLDACVCASRAGVHVSYAWWRRHAILKPDDCKGCQVWSGVCARLRRLMFTGQSTRRLGTGAHCSHTLSTPYSFAQDAFLAQFGSGKASGAEARDTLLRAPLPPEQKPWCAHSLQILLCGPPSAARRGSEAANSILRS